MGRFILFIIGLGVAVGAFMPNSKLASSGHPHRVSTPSEPAKETLLERSDSGHFYTYAKVNGELVHFVVDTGADVVALTTDDAERLGIPVNPANFTVIGEGASGPVRGENVTIDSIEVDGKLVNDVDGVVLADSNMTLLGQSSLSRMGEVQMRGDYMVLR